MLAPLCTQARDDLKLHICKVIEIPIHQMHIPMTFQRGSNFGEYINTCPAWPIWE